MSGRRRIDGRPALALSSADGSLQAAFVPSAGMVCCSLLHRGEEILGQRNGLRGYIERKSTMGIPLLYPWANRLERDRLEVAGATIDVSGDPPQLKRDGAGLPIHGLLTAAPGWEVSVHEPSGENARLLAEFDWAAHPDLLRLFPFRHRVTIDAHLTASRLTIATTVTATGTGPVPIAYGFHPYLRLPSVARELWELELPVSVQLELDARGLPTGERREVSLGHGALGERAFDDLFLAPGNGRPFALSGGGRRIELAMNEGYPYAQIYAPAGEEMIAFEPMTAPTNALASGAEEAIEPDTASSAVFSISIT